MLKKQLKDYPIFYCIVVSILVITSTARADDEIYYSQLSLSGGGSQTTTTKGAFTSIGSVFLGYHYFFSEKYNFKTSFQYSSSLSGFDLGLNYCLFGSCTTSTKTVGEVMKITENGTWGVNVGAGVAQRFFKVTSGTLTSMGFFGSLDISRSISKNFRAQLELETTFLSNGSQSIRADTFALGLSYVLGGIK